jgi:ElaB/YqjD/DUF883 family membrane-anchored ribosome-binding protein
MPRRKRKSNPNGNHRQGRMSAVRADLDALQKDVRGLMSDVGGSTTREVRDAMGGAVDRLEAWGTTNLASVRDAVRNQPLKACAISIGAGAILGALLMR